jgi:two-component system chemotaxis sensor kinase CheA
MHYHEIAGQKLLLEEDAVRASSAIFIKVKDSVLALIVDKVESQADLVVKPFSKIVKPVRGFKGISVLADEKVCYIVHPEEMIKLMQNQTVSQEERSAA